MTAKRQALGRGLGALLGERNLENSSQLPRKTVVGDEVGVIGAIITININSIDTNPYQPRTEFDLEALNELAASIKVSGIIQPITVRKRNERYQLISGERRLRASKIVGLEEIPAYVRMANDNEMIEMALVENIQRQDLNAIDIALSYQAMLDVCKYSQEKLSERVGKKRSTVTNYLRLLKLPAELQIAIKDGKLSMGHARAMISIEDAGKQIQLLRKIIDKALSVRQVEEKVRRILDGGQSLKNKKVLTKELPQYIKDDFEKLSNKLNAEVSARLGSKGKGSILIDFTSEANLQKILSLLNE